jgi:hypothetical protein
MTRRTKKVKMSLLVTFSLWEAVTLSLIYRASNPSVYVPMHLNDEVQKKYDSTSALDEIILFFKFALTPLTCKIKIFQLRYTI